MPPSSDGRSPNTLGHRLDRLPPGRRWVVDGLVLAGLLAVVYLLMFGAMTLLSDDPVNWLQPLPAPLSFAGPYIGVRIRRRRLGGAELMRDYERAARAGRLPDGADPAVWQPLLVRELDAQRWARFLPHVLVGVLAVPWVLVVVLYDLGLLWGLLAVALFASFGAWLRWLGRQQARRTQRLLDQLTGAPAE